MVGLGSNQGVVLGGSQVGGSPVPLEGGVESQDRLLLGMAVVWAYHEVPWDRGAESW